MNKASRHFHTDKKLILIGQLHCAQIQKNAANGSLMSEVNKNAGFTLVELLLTLGLSAFIMSTAYILFASQQQTYAGQQAIVNSQEVGRVATTLLRDRLRQAGGLGCSNWHAQLPFYNKTTALEEWVPQQAQDKVSGYHADNDQWSPVLPAYLTGRVRAGTDVLIIHQAYEQAANLLQDMSHAQAPLFAPQDLNLQVNDVLMVADCQQADMFKISHLSQRGGQWVIDHQPPNNVSNQLSKAYTRTAQISVVQNAAYYVGDTGRRYLNDQPIYALYQFNGQHQELLEGVTGLRVWYGVDSNNDNAVDTIMETPPTAAQGVIHSVLVEIDTQIMHDNEHIWYLTATLRN